ncbi:nucleoporin-like protein [Cadophora sp. MPI-SDFR-AT-0126]|nr:nucleoporin-like protein [Leotiomycetes sp. MPI-SDFR-AT-0126]
MAPILASSYFPPLDKCLIGEELLVSWKSVFSAVTSKLDLGHDHTTVIGDFLTNEQVLELLENPYAAYPPPSVETKIAFDTKTSAINVTPSSNAQYDIKEIKEDALWLSKAANINEVSALRVVVEECQSRAAAQLLGPFSEEELASIRDGAGNNRYSSSIPVGLMSQGAEAQQTQKEFGLQENRRKRILRTYLSERRHILKCSERIFHQVFLSYVLPDETTGNGTPFAIVPEWLQTFVTGPFTRKLNADKFPGPNDILKRCIGGITTNMKNLMTGSGWFSEDGGREDVEMDWTRSQITEAIHSMELMWQFLQNYCHEPCSSETVLAWFNLQQDYNFFSSFDLEDQSVQILFSALQSISGILSLSILRLDDAVEQLSNPSISEVVLGAPGREIYMQNTQTMIDITNILIQAADNRLNIASPTVLAWSIILQTMTDRMLALEAAENSPDERASSVDTSLTLAPDPYKEVLEQINDILEEDVIDYLARSAIDSCQVFDVLSSLASRLGNTTSALFSNFVGAEMRGSILSLIRYSTRVGYNAEILGASVMALTSGENYWEIRNSDHIFSSVDPVAKFWNDQALKGVLLQNAVWRYPFESMPFLQLLRALAYRSSTPRKEEPKGNVSETETVQETDAEIYDPKTIAEILDAMPFFTYALPANFVDYETTQEEENNNSIRLTKGINLFVPRSYTLRSLPGQSSSLVSQNADFHIPAGTIGRIVSESDPKVAYWYHQYSGFAYMGKLLETFLAASDLVDATTGQPADRDSVSEIIEIFALLISPAKSNLPPFEAATEMLDKASSGLSHDRDIIGVIFDIFQEELQNQSASSGAEVSLDILVNCVHFIHALLPLYPARVWPLLTHSGLLDLGRGSGKLPVIVEGVELLSGKYDLLISCCHLFDSLVEDFATNAIKRRSNGLPSQARLTSSLHQSSRDVSTGIPERTASNIIFSFARYFVEVLESSRTWKYNSQDDRRWISKIIASSFDNILNYAFGLEAPIELDPAETQDTANSEKALVRFSPMARQNGDLKDEKQTKVMEGLMLGASHIIESFLSTSSGTLRFQPLLRSYFDGFETPETTVYLNLLDLWTGQVGSILYLSQTLLRVKTMLGMLPSQLEAQMFKSSSLIARLYAAHDTYKTKVVGLFEALIVTASSDEAAEPPSLLGHLGPHTARNFLHCLSDLDKPLTRQVNLTTIWHFLSMVMSSRQQWFANYLLTGKTPSEAVNVKSGAKKLVALDKPLLSTALDTLSNINDLPQPSSLAMLEFVALAQNYWPWTVCNSPQYKAFIDSMQDFVGRLKPLGQSKDLLEGLIEDCYQTRISAYVAEILAMHLFHSRQTGASVQLKSLITNLSYFKRFAAAVPDYKQSLHGLLKKNFESKYPGCTIGDLKRMPLERRQLGTDYFYNTSLADRMLSLDQGWYGVQGNGLRDDVQRANINLSLVDAQIALFHSWKFLSIELSSNIATEPEVQTLLSAVVSNCLVANGQSQPPEEIFSTLSQTRADLALVLGQRLVQAKSSIPDMQRLLPTVWKTIESLRGTFDKPLLDDELLYYRSLLKLLFLAIRVHAKAPTQSENLAASTRASQSAAIPTILSILEHVVAKGLRELATSIHDSPADSSPEDLALITGILQSCLRIPGIELNHGQIVVMMVNSSAPLLAVKLFSWAETLTIDGDPIYGELSILFLLELSSMPPMAEQLAVSGILSQIYSAPITTYFRRPGVSPFAETAGLQRCYSIWARGILPLILNLLDAVQSAIAIEVAQFLSQFPLMLAYSEQAFDTPETDRIIPKGQMKYITATICSEVHSMSLLVYILTGFREALISTMDIPDVKWDAAGVLENVMFWLQPGSSSLLRSRIIPMGEREVEEVQKAKRAGKTVSSLENRIVAELKGIRDVLSSVESS